MTSVTAPAVSFELLAPAPASVPEWRPTPAQARVVAHERGPLLVLGAPGTGKTRTLAQSVVQRVHEGAPPEEILVLTWSRAAAAELRGHMARLLGTGASPAVLTPVALCRHVLTHYGEHDPALRLLSAAEQDAMLSQALAGWGAERWPESLRPALATPQFAEQLRAIFARARALGMDPEDLTAAGRAAGKPEWECAGAFFEEYLNLLDFRQALDHAEMVHRARLLFADPGVLTRARADVSFVAVDEYHDIDDAQAALVRDLVGPGGSIVAFGDPDQAIFAFRGAAARALGSFAADYAGGEHPPEVVALDESRRLGAELHSALAPVRDRLPQLSGVDAAARAWREPRPAGPPGQARVLTFDHEAAQAEFIADRLRRAHLDEGVAWTQMAVIVRSARRSIGRLARALQAHGVPVEVAGDEVALGEESAVRPLLRALAVVVDERWDEAAADELLGSPLAGVDAVARRRLYRALAKAAAGADTIGLLRDVNALSRAGADAGDDRELASSLRRAQGLARALDAARDAAQRGESGHAVLWALWEATEWPQRLQKAAVGGGEDARAAHQALDAVCALFALAARHASEHDPSPRALLAAVESQRLPANAGAERAHRDAVRVLTAHRAKGLEWDTVVVAGVQEGLWPALRVAPTLLAADRLLRDGIAEAPPVALRVAEERRLFYVACSRARRRLVVTAVDDEVERPSRFLAELGVETRHVAGVPARPRTLPGLVAELRRVATDPSQSPQLRRAAAARLARLGAAVDDEGRRLVAVADPQRWWGVLEPTAPALASPAAPGTSASVDEPPVTLTPSGVETLLTCPRRWFLSRRAHVEQSRAGASSLGSVVHALVEGAARDGWEEAELRRRLDDVWPELSFAAPWQEQREREQAEEMIGRYVQWSRQRDAAVVGVEVPFDITVDVPQDRVRLVGAVDRLERVGDRLRVVDFKTSKHPPTKAEAARLPQFGVYQLAVEAGAFASLAPGRESAGAVGVYLRKPAAQGAGELHQPSLTDHPWSEGEDPTAASSWVHARLGEAAAVVRHGRFPATPGKDCQWCAFASACPARPEGQQVSA